MLAPHEVIDGYIGARARAGTLHSAHYVYPEDFDGSGTLAFNSSGPDNISGARRKRRIEQWREAFPSLSAKHVVLAGPRLDQETFDAATKVKGLEILVVYQSSIESIESISNACSLVGARIRSSRKISSYTPLSELPNLRSLTLDNPKSLTSIDFVKSLPLLEDFSIFHTPDSWMLIDSLWPLRCLRHLQRVLVSGVKVSHDGLRPLYGLPLLENAQLSYVFKADEFAELVASTPTLRHGSAFQKHLIAEYCD
ncbi:hypothetical protein D3C81_456530 [compost metagenome]